MMLARYLASLLLIGSVVRFADSYTCKQKEDNRCAAECVDDDIKITLDISNIVKYPRHISVDPDSSDADTVSSFVFNCHGDTNSCGLSEQPTSVCMTDTDSKRYSCGSAIITEWNLVQTKPYLFTVEYGGGICEGLSCKKSLFNFIETSENDVSVDFIRFDMDGSTEVYIFDVSGPCVGQPNCKLPSSSSGSIIGIIGFSIILVAIAGIIAYFVIGSSIMYFKKGARGKEVIPQVTFWISLPGLVWDGCQFVFSPVLKRKSEYQPL